MKTSSSLWYWVFLLFLLTGSLLSLNAQSDLGVIVRDRARIDGQIEGPLQVLSKNGTVDFGMQGSMSGAFTAPKNFVGRASDRPLSTDKDIGAEQTASRGSGSTYSYTRSATSFEVAAPSVRAVPANTDYVSKTSRILPEGTYGNVMVDQATLVLGDRDRVAKYDFSYLEVGEASAVELRGPVVVTVAGGLSIKGVIGVPGRPHWLDLRVASGIINFGSGSKISAFVNAPVSAVVLGPQAELYGGILCQEIDMQLNSKVFIVRPNWNDRVAGGTGPVFVHKMLRVKSRVAELVEHYSERYVLALDYPSEIPILTINQKIKLQHKESQIEEYRLFFEAVRSLLEETGFDGARISMIRGVDKSDQSEKLDLTLSREDLEDAFWALSREREPKDAVLKIQSDPVLLQLFMLRCVNSSKAVWKELQK